MSDVLFPLMVNDIRTLQREHKKLWEDLQKLETSLKNDLQGEDQQTEDKRSQLEDSVLQCPPIVTTIAVPKDRKSHQQLGLNWDSEWISSCFYSHPLGYKLCLALKSTALSNPIPRSSVAYTRKPKLDIAIVAISQDDDRHRSWPCEGEITLKILDQRKCKPFTTKFCMKKPVISEHCVLSKSKELNWTMLPEEAIPFGQYYSPSWLYTTSGIPDYQLNIRIEMVLLSEDCRQWNCCV